MKDMEIKTENRYEYRKTQEKRKQMIAPDLFEFAYVPDWYGHLAELERLALPESWRFRKPSRETKNTETPILERYIHTIFRKQVIDFNSESDPRKADSIFHLENECVCFHTGLYTPQYKGIYGYFERNNFSDSLRDWYFRGFCDELSPKLRYIEPLPQKPVYHMAQSGINFNPEWPIRVNVNHILGDEENLERIPAKIRKVKNLPLLFETAVELGRRKSVIEPGLVVPQGYQGRVQYLLPVYLTNMQKPDLAMTLTVMDGYYLGNTCLTLEMGNLNPSGHGQGGNVYHEDGIAPTVTVNKGCGTRIFIDQSNHAPKLTENARCITARYTSGMVNHTAMNSAVMEVHPVLTPERMEKRQNGRRMKEDGEPMFTLTSQDRHGVFVCEKVQQNEETMLRVRNGTKQGYDEAHVGDGISLAYPESDTRRGRVGKGCSQTLDCSGQMGTLMKCGRIRRLTPRECFRLQGFPDVLFDKAASVNSDAQLYKQAGNAVTATVAFAVAMSLPESREN